ncbi:MAG: hypothetical protein IAB81_07525 [Bacteroidetes bacterium]|uniref:Flavodoxin-like domain-containing protein n=1 Tax=Candidatus Merdivivens pullicola TaxID=2840872 RepID=A0A9D9IKF3_9BACT|nr:hypothetical protein [Candidatus Merdivivens pullicola]
MSVKCIIINGKLIGRSGINNSENALKKAYPSINWQTGRLLNRATKASVEDWVK